MKKGDYVRTNLYEEHIIARIVNITKSIDGSNWLELDKYTKYNYYDDQPEHFKTSPNIIDLIEVGDYVNGKEVINCKEKWIQLYDKRTINDDEIKLILTKEQFENMEYRIGE